MRKISTLCMALLMAASMQAFANGKATVGKSFHGPLPAYPVSVPGMNVHNLATQQNGQGFFTGVQNAPKLVTDDPATQVADSYGWIMGPDGYYWHYTMDIQKELVPRDDDYKEYKYLGADVVIYDNNNLKKGSFHIAVPDTMKCNQIQLYVPVTTKLFDRNDKTYEVMCDLHHANKGQTYNVTRAYSVNTGECLFDKRGLGIIFSSEKSAWDKYQRLIFTNDNMTKDGKFGGSDAYYTSIKIYKPGEWSQTGTNPVDSVKEFLLDQNLCYYMQGTYINCYTVGGEPYYVLAQYEKPWELERTGETDDEGNTEDGSYNVVQRPDNHLVLTTYDKNFNEVNSIKVDGNTPEGWNHRTLGFGQLGFNDLSKGYFTGDDQFNYVLVAYDYEATKGDEDFVTFTVYNSKGEKVKDIVKEASSSWWKVMSSVPGKEDQIAFLQTIASADQITLVNVPSCEQASVLPASIEGNPISTTLDRKASTKNSYGYQYVVSLGQAEADKDKNMISPIAWINPDATIDHKDAMNLGQNGQLFTPMLNDVTLNPYVFDTDDEMEYIYLAKKKRTDGSGKIDNVLEIAKADGTVIKRFESDEVHHLIQPAVIPVDGDGRYRLVVVYQNLETGKYEMTFTDLPFTKFADGGDGTKDNPYMVATAGDLKMMGQGKTAYYKLANDIDMTENGLWKPVDDFQGELDGDNHAIFNLYVNDSQGRVGLFANMGFGGHVKNLNFIKPTIELLPSNLFAGIVAGSCTTDNTNGKTSINACENVHVVDGNISGSADAVVGGIIGDATLNGHVKSSSFQGEINVPQSTSGVGGIVGTTYTGSSIMACSSNLKAVAGENLGGILGELCKNTGSVFDCESQGSLSAGNTLGGIVGSSNREGTINRCISRCDLTATSPSRFAGYATGGIVGLLEADAYYSDKSSYVPLKVVTNNVATGNIYLKDGETTAKFDGTKAKENRVHLIAGSSTDDDSYKTKEVFNEEIGDWEETILSYAKELGLDNNYTTTNLSDNTDASTTEGKFVETASLDKSFFQNAANFGGKASYAYGSTTDAPWKGNKIPVMYYDSEPKAITISAQDVQLGLNAPDATLQVVVYGVDNAEDIEATSSNSKTVEVTIDKVEGNVATLKLHALKTGIANITISYGGFSTDCNVTVMKTIYDGIENVEAGNLQVRMGNGYISADGANTIYVYTVNGQLVAKSHGEAISTTPMAAGIYVVKALGAAGSMSTAKFVVK